MPEQPDDRRHMDHALSLAGRGLGNVWPNPAVGCVIVRDGVVVGRGWTQPGGRPHAETEALARAGDRARGATAYVSLEPCAHHGRTPPCADALIASGIARAVVALEDPDPRVAGRGSARLEAAGIAVTRGVREAEARRLNAGFLSRIQRGRPLVTLKSAVSLDGMVATATGASQWITGPQARARGHLLRAEHDAILVGRGTVVQDDPRLDCRLAGLAGRSPVRVVLDSALRLAATSRLVESARSAPLWAICRAPAEAGRRDALIARGAEVIEAASDGDGRVDAADALRRLAQRGITRVLAEAGPRLAASLLRAGLVDRLALFRAPLLIGGDGAAFAGPLGVTAPQEGLRLGPADPLAIGPDWFELRELMDRSSESPQRHDAFEGIL
jgi:diaminohydroxyphosphoribosylaminopyrimidine deaminase/5-amino-6-(5-phosphoribosylamino)uracil reductase